MVVGSYRTSIGSWYETNECWTGLAYFNFAAVQIRMWRGRAGDAFAQGDPFCTATRAGAFAFREMCLDRGQSNTLAFRAGTFGSWSGDASGRSNLPKACVSRQNTNAGTKKTGPDVTCPRVRLGIPVGNSRLCTCGLLRRYELGLVHRGTWTSGRFGLRFGGARSGPATISGREGEGRGRKGNE
jgi:hypothetical protein